MKTNEICTLLDPQISNMYLHLQLSIIFYISHEILILVSRLQIFKHLERENLMQNVHNVHVKYPGFNILHYNI